MFYCRYGIAARECDEQGNNYRLGVNKQESYAYADQEIITAIAGLPIPPTVLIPTSKVIRQRVRLVATIDGLRLDENGRIWTSAEDGVHCYEPDGTLIGKILVPEEVSNLVFGGQRYNRMFITASSSLYSVLLSVRGLKTF